MKRTIRNISWLGLLGLGLCAGIATALAFPDTMLLGGSDAAGTRLLLGAGVALPAALFAFAFGPSPGHWRFPVLLVGLLSWAPLSWVGVWAASGSDAPFFAWLEEISDEVVVVERPTILGLPTGEWKEKHGGGRALIQENVFMLAGLGVVVSLLPLVRARCSRCGSPSPHTLLGWLPWEPLSNVHETSRASIVAWVEDRGARLHRMAEPGPAARLLLHAVRCGWCGNTEIAARGLLPHANKLVKLRPFAISAEALAALEGRGTR